MKKLVHLFALLLLMPTAAVASGRPEVAANPAQSWIGVWRNTHNTMHIRMTTCGTNSMCGTVVWADPQTTADVAKRGKEIVGMQLFSGFHQTAPTEWRGTVYVPTIGRNFSGKITLTDHNNLVAVGCLILGLGCQTRHWSRIA